VDDIRQRLRAGGGAIDRRSHRDVAGAIDRMLRTGDLVAVLPAVYCTPADAEHWAVRVVAASLWLGPDAVFTGAAAARLTFWPDCPADTISLARPGSARRSRSGIQVEKRVVPPDLVVSCGALCVTAPSLTALDLTSQFGGDGIDRALRSRTTTLAQMYDAFALQPNRRGNDRLAALLRDSRNEPWSAAERLMHRLLHRHHITGWSGNRWLEIGGSRYCVDVLFSAQRLILEVDGWESHGSRDAFEADRRRRNALVLAGYAVLNFTWRQLHDEPDWVRGNIAQALGR
jgi:very-short-patch-repair endonuclease